MKPVRWAGLAALLTSLLFVGCTSEPAANTSATNEPAGNAAASTSPGKAAKPLTIGFSQVGAESGWRTANTKSIQEAASARGHTLKFSDAQGKQENQIKAIRSFIAQDVDVIAFSPIVETGWGQVLKEAKDAGIPVIVSDRRPNVPEDLYVTVIGSDFIKEGEMAAEWMLKNVQSRQNCGTKRHPWIGTRQRSCKGLPLQHQKKPTTRSSSVKP